MEKYPIGISIDSMKKKRLEKSGLLTFSDFSDLLTQSGRRTVNSDSFVINDLNKKGRGTITEFRELVKKSILLPKLFCPFTVFKQIVLVISKFFSITRANFSHSSSEQFW